MNRRARLCRLIVVALLVLGASGGAATAGLVIEGAHTEGPFVGFSTGSFALPRFDTLGGTRTLTDVTVEVIIDSYGGKREFDNQSPAAGLVTIAIGSTVRVKGPIPVVGSQIIVIPNAVTTASTFITGTTGDLPADFAGPDYAFVNGPIGGISNIKNASRSSAGDLAPYIGAGTVTFNWDLAGNSTAGEDVSVTGGGAFRTTSTTYNFHTTVFYTYVPEPGSIVLGGLGLLGLLVTARRVAARQRAARR